MSLLTLNCIRIKTVRRGTKSSGVIFLSMEFLVSFIAEKRVGKGKIQHIKTVVVLEEVLLLILRAVVAVACLTNHFTILEPQN